MKPQRGSSQNPGAGKPLDLSSAFDGKQLIIIGGTGFLGKVWWSLLLDRFECLGHVYLVVRQRGQMSSSERFWNEIAGSDCFEPLRQRYQQRYVEFLREKVTVIDGDIAQPFCGIDAKLRERLRGKIHAVANASGIVDFQPPLDRALEVNAFGAQSLVQLARDLGDVAVMHTSTCYVAGYRPGIVEEVNPLVHPFPHAGKLERAHWDPDREINECLDIIEQAKHRAGDAFRQSHFLDQAKSNLRERGEPARGTVLEAEIERVRRRFVEAQLAELGQERARFWGWPNTYTYTKSIGEQIVARSGLPFTIVRPAIIESCVEYPVVGWNEGINTSAPLIYAIREGQMQLPGAAVRLDIIPCDMVAGGMIVALAELLRGEAKPVYQFGTSDSNPVTMARIYELSGLYKRRHHQASTRGSAWGRFVQAHVEGALLSPKRFAQIGPRRVAREAERLAGVLERISSPAVSAVLKPTADQLHRLARSQAKIGEIALQFQPFTAELDYEFRCDNTRAACARLSAADRSRIPWSPETIDWRRWFLEVHVPGLERWVFPEIEKRMRKPLRALRRHESLVHLLEEMAERHDWRVALAKPESDGLSRVSFRQWWERARACAVRLVDSGVQPGDRVALVAQDSPEWAIGFFGVLLAGAAVVPLDAAASSRQLAAWAREARVQLALVDGDVANSFSATVPLRCLLLDEATVAVSHKGAVRGPPATEAKADDVAVLSYTRGTTGAAKLVVLTHGNLSSALASLAPVFRLSVEDRVLSTQPWHELFSLTCGLLLPLSRGSRVICRSPNEEDLEQILRRARVTTLVATAAFWERFGDRLRQRWRRQPGWRQRLARGAVHVNLKLGRAAGIDVGRVLFAPLHREWGGQLALLLSGQGPLDTSTHRLLAGLGLQVSELYTLVEGAPALAAGVGCPGGQGGASQALPEIELKIVDADADGVGEVWARGPSVAARYSDPALTRSRVSEDGWLRTGDLGSLDTRGRLTLIGRVPVEQAATAKLPSAAAVQELVRSIAKRPVAAVPAYEGSRGVAEATKATRPRRP